MLFFDITIINYAEFYQSTINLQSFYSYSYFFVPAILSNLYGKCSEDLFLNWLSMFLSSFLSYFTLIDNCKINIYFLIK